MMTVFMKQNMWENRWKMVRNLNVSFLPDHGSALLLIRKTASLFAAVPLLPVSTSTILKWPTGTECSRLFRNMRQLSRNCSPSIRKDQKLNQFIYHTCLIPHQTGITTYHWLLQQQVFSPSP